MSKILRILSVIFLAGCKDTIVTQVGRKVTVTDRYTLGGGLFVPGAIEYSRTVEQEGPTK